MLNQALTLGQQLDKFEKALKDLQKDELAARSGKAYRRRLMALHRAIADTRVQILATYNAPAGEDGE